MILLKYLYIGNSKIILLNRQNNYIERLSIDDNAAKKFEHFSILKNKHNYFDSPNEVIFKSEYLYLHF